MHLLGSITEKFDKIPMLIFLSLQQRMSVENVDLFMWGRIHGKVSSMLSMGSHNVKQMKVVQ